MRESINQAKIGSIVPVYEELGVEVDALEYFAKLSNYGKKNNSLLIEYKNRTIGTVNPCLVLTGKGIDFEIKALSDSGKRFLQYIKKDFGFCDKVVYKKDRIHGTLTHARKAVSEEQILKFKTPMDIIRTVAFKFRQTNTLLPCGLFGLISYDFVNNIEDFSSNEEDPIKDQDYVLYFLDDMFVINKKTKKICFVVNTLITDNKKDKIYSQCSKIINNYKKLMDKKLPKNKKVKKKAFEVNYDMDNDEFMGMINRLKRNIMDGNILQASPSRMAICNYNAEPLDIYAQFKGLNENFPLFYLNDDGVCMGSGSGTCLRVRGGEERIVELKTVTSTKPRGNANESIDNDMDNKYEIMLRTDEDETIKHTMMVDSARNEIAKISEKKTRYVDRLFRIEKQKHTQNLISNVKGFIQDEYDALHAYTATINFDVGIPKIKAVSLLRTMEKTNRGFYSGSFVHISPNGNLESNAIETLRFKNNKVYVRKNSCVVHNTHDKNEAQKNEGKILQALEIIKAAGGLK